MKKRHLILSVVLAMQGMLAACSPGSGYDEKTESTESAQKNTQIVILEPTPREQKKDLTVEKAEEELINRFKELEDTQKLMLSNAVYCANRYIGNVPTFDQWRGILNLPQLTDHLAYGRQFVQADEKKECSLVTDYRLEVNKSLYEYEILEGDWLEKQKKGQCIIADNLATALKKQVGEKITIEMETGSKSFEIVGIFDYTEQFLEQYPDVDTEIDEIYINKEDYIECVSEDGRGSYFPWAFFCADKESEAAFVAEAQNLVSEDYASFYTSDELQAKREKEAETDSKGSEEIEEPEIDQNHSEPGGIVLPDEIIIEGEGG